MLPRTDGYSFLRVVADVPTTGCPYRRLNAYHLVTSVSVQLNATASGRIATLDHVETGVHDEVDTLGLGVECIIEETEAGQIFRTGEVGRIKNTRSIQQIQ